MKSYLLPSITVAPPNLEVIMSYIILFDRQFVPLSGPNLYRTRTEHVQNEGCFFRQKGTRNCNANTMSVGIWTRFSTVPVRSLNRRPQSRHRKRRKPCTVRPSRSVVND